MMSELGAAFAVAGPIAARVILAIGISAAIQLRAGQDIVLAYTVAAAADYFAALGERRILTNMIAFTRGLECVSVQVAEV